MIVDKREWHSWERLYNPHMQLSGINIDNTTYDEVVDKASRSIWWFESLRIATPNPEMLLEAFSDQEYREVLASADLKVPDGIGVFIAFQKVRSGLPRWLKNLSLPIYWARAVLGERGLRKTYGERITWADLTKDILDICASQSVPVVILDRVVEVIESPFDTQKLQHQETVCDDLARLYPGLEAKLLTLSGEPPPNGVVEWISQMVDSDYVLLSTTWGKRQDRLVRDVMYLDQRVRLGIGIGWSIDLLTGFRAPAPAFVRKLGFEWLYRLLKRPKNHCKRIRNVLEFLVRV